jgi:hypothetical protein
MNQGETERSQGEKTNFEEKLRRKKSAGNIASTPGREKGAGPPPSAHSA